MAAPQDTETPAQKTTRQHVVQAHGIVMGITFVLFFPFGSLIVRLFSITVRVHAAWQAFAYTCALGGFGMGVWLAWDEGAVSSPP